MRSKVLWAFWGFITFFGLEIFGSDSLKYYCSPLKEDFSLTGTFAELRMNHFHSGIDYGTMGREMLPVYSVADGYVSRIKIEAGGYGNAIYIDHPNGTTSVYAHLKGFKNVNLLQFIKDKQYENSSFAIDLFTEKNQFVVKKGEVIAYSGNTGTSSAPHLHFEIRDYKTQNPINVMGKIPGLIDNFYPSFKSLYVYNVDSIEYGISTKTIYRIKKINDKRFEIPETIIVPAYTSFGLLLHDQISINGFNGGIRTIELKMDSVFCFQQTIDQLSYNETRYVNAYIDYKELLLESKEIHLQLILPNNQLNFYNTSNKGYFAMKDSQVHQLTYFIEDFFGNRSEFSFKIKSTTLYDSAKHFVELDSTVFRWNRNYKVEKDAYYLNIQAGTLFNNMIFRCDTVAHNIRSLYSPIYKLEPEFNAFFKPFQFGIKPNSTLPDSMYNKLLIAYVDIVKNILTPINGKYTDGKVIANLRNFGYYALTIDTVAPKIEPLFNAENTINIESISFKIIDEFSGIATYEGKIDGQWVLFEYNLKRNLISHNFDFTKYKNNTEHIGELKVSDTRGNVNFYQFKFFK